LTNDPVDDEFTARRERLLESLESGGVEVGLTDGDQGMDDSTAEPPPKRLRLDVASSRRLLFGSLGVRNPKTKEDEQKLSEQLMTRNQRNAIPYEKQLVDENGVAQNNAVKGATAVAQDEVQQGDDWKLNITLSAVECVDEGVQLSTPPFPFQQRWDPQYRGRYRNGNKKAARKSYGNFLENGHGESVEGVFNDVEIPEQSDRKAKKVKKNVFTLQDLPELPSNLDALPDAKPADVTPGAIIAFKQVECDETTNYVPTVSDYRTARIDAVTGTNEYDVVLAQRDRPVKDTRYDNDGNRIWGRYEMPDEENEVDDDGLRHLSYSELMVPKIVQSAPSANSPVKALAEMEGNGSILADEVNSTTSSKSGKKKNSGGKTTLKT
jgi:hypothetical protein